MEIRFNSCGRYVAVSDNDLERLAEKYRANGGFAGHGYPFAVFVLIEATKLLERADAANPACTMTRQVVREMAARGSLN